MILSIISLVISEWLIIPFIDNQWELTLFIQYILIALLFTYISYLILDRKLLERSIFVLLTLDAWFDVFKFALWQYSNTAIDFSIIGSLMFFCWLLFVIKRQYPEKLDLVNLDNINILILKPKTIFDVIKGLIGYPASSICICANGYVWCFRRKSGVFEKMPYHYQWTESHLVIDTGIKCTQEHKQMLDNLVGTVRTPCIKCVYVIRCLLNTLGCKYSIKSWFDYIPGIYFMRIL